MKQLHSSYSNLGSWKKVYDPDTGVVRFVFDRRRGILTSIILFIACLAAAIWLSSIRSNTGNDDARVWGVWILALTGIIVPLVIIVHGISERRKGDLIQYSANEDFLVLPRIGRTVNQARARVCFSSEHYTRGYGNHSFELNLVVDGQRIKFLSSCETNAFRSITKPLESLGFAVNHQKIKIKDAQ